MLGGCPKPKYGFAEAIRRTREWGMAMAYAEICDLANAGVKYAEAGRQTAALRMARILLTAPEDAKGAEGESNILKAARVIIALYKATGEPGWALCAKRIANMAQGAGKIEDAAQILEEAGFESDAAIARSELRLSQWADQVDAGEKKK